MRSKFVKGKMYVSEDVEKSSCNSLQIVLVIGTTQQHIISILSLQAKRHAADVITAENSPESVPRPITETNTAPKLCGTDKLFWFDNAKLVLRLLHFVKFQVTIVNYPTHLLAHFKLSFDLVLRAFLSVSRRTLLSLPSSSGYW